jgi:hypothetical protein
MFYTVFLVFAAGVGFLLLSFIIYTPRHGLVRMSRREQGGCSPRPSWSSSSSPWLASSPGSWPWRLAQSPSREYRND